MTNSSFSSCLSKRQSGSPIIVALSYSNSQQALTFADQVSPCQCRLKIGKMLTYSRLDLIRGLQKRGFDVFLDLKFHDIPNTVAKAVNMAADLGVWMINVHAIGGERMMMAARDALVPFGDDAPILIAVTVLTSMNNEDLRGLGISSSVSDYTMRLAILAKQCGMDGVVCSAWEAPRLKSYFGTTFMLVTPGIRPIGSDVGDQRRVMTPLQAQKAGVDYMVIGRPIIQTDNPSVTLTNILYELKTGKIHDCYK